MGICAGRQSRFGKVVPSAYFDSFRTSYRMQEGIPSHRFHMRSQSSVRRGRMRVICTMAGILAVAAGPAWVRAQQPEPAGQLIRETVYNELRARGHNVSRLRPWGMSGCATAVMIDPASGNRFAAADPRRDCYAIAY